MLFTFLFCTRAVSHSFFFCIQDSLGFRSPPLRRYPRSFKMRDAMPLLECNHVVHVHDEGLQMLTRYTTTLRSTSCVGSDEAALY